MRRSLVICLAAFAIADASATDLPRIFMTSVHGTGDLSSWADAHGMSGTAAADEICRTRAAAASLADADQYIALVSDTQSDAYCRLHGDTGQRFANNCNADTLPTGAGPWYRMDDLPAMDVAENAVGTDPEGGYVPRHILYDEFGVALTPGSGSDQFAFTATGWSGTLDGNGSCGDWTSASGDVALGDAFHGYGNVDTGSWTCDQSLRLICLEKGKHGPALARVRPPSARGVFITSSQGTGDLSTWPDADGATSLDAADAICRAHASRASLPLARTYKAWLSTSTAAAADRFAFDGPFYRTDGVRIAASLAGLATVPIEAPPQLDESGGDGYFVQTAWTATNADGTADSTHTCQDWTSSSSSSVFGSFGQAWAADGTWTYIGPPFSFISCNTPMHLYCFGDNDSLFFGDFD